MVSKDRQLSDSRYLDKEKENKLFIHFIYNPDGPGIEEFCIGYWLMVDERPVELVRFDCSLREKLHIHYFFCNPPRKKGIDREVNYETMQECIDEIEANWRKWLLKYNETKDYK
jgi:hypothetical protein